MIRDLFRHHFKSEHEFQRFATWAFGFDWLSIDKGRELAQEWNNHHHGDYWIRWDGDISQDAEWILQIWRER